MQIDFFPRKFAYAEPVLGIVEYASQLQHISWCNPLFKDFFSSPLPLICYTVIQACVVLFVQYPGLETYPQEVLTWEKYACNRKEEQYCEMKQGKWLLNHR